MKKALALIALTPLLFACSDLHHRGPGWIVHPTDGQTNLHHCTVGNNGGLTWSRTGATRNEACHRANLACRHSYGNLHHRHRPSRCTRLRFN